MSIYGYIRVSTREQNEGRQLVSLQEVGITDKFIFIRDNLDQNIYNLNGLNGLELNLVNPSVKYCWVFYQGSMMQSLTV